MVVIIVLKGKNMFYFEFYKLVCVMGEGGRCEKVVVCMNWIWIMLFIVFEELFIKRICL